MLHHRRRVLGLRGPPLLEIKEQLLPALLALTDAVDNGDQAFTAVGRCSHQDEEALLRVGRVFQPHIRMNAVGPDGDMLLAREVTAAPLLVLLARLLLEADLDVGTEPLGILPEQRL